MADSQIGIQNNPLKYQAAAHMGEDIEQLATGG